MTTPAVPTTVTVDLVASMTGTTVTDAVITQAISIIELCMAIDLTNLANLTSNNRRWAVKAIAYQAAWMPGQPDLMQRIDVTSMNQDGLSLSTRDKDSLIIAPLAQKAFSRVSWERSRTVMMGLGRAARLARLAQEEMHNGPERFAGDLVIGGGGVTRAPIVAGRAYYDADDDADGSAWTAL